MTKSESHERKTWWLSVRVVACLGLFIVGLDLNGYRTPDQARRLCRGRLSGNAANGRLGRSAIRRIARLKKPPLAYYRLRQWDPGRACPLDRPLAVCDLRTGLGGTGRRLDRSVAWPMVRTVGGAGANDLGLFHQLFPQSRSGHAAVSVDDSGPVSRRPWSQGRTAKIQGIPLDRHLQFDRLRFAPSFIMARQWCWASSRPGISWTEGDQGFGMCSIRLDLAF